MRNFNSISNFLGANTLQFIGGGNSQNEVRKTEGEQPRNRQRISNLSLTLVSTFVRYAACIALLLCLCVGQMWGTDFTQGEVKRGKTASNISVSTTGYSNTSGKQICNSGSAVKDSAVAITSGDFIASGPSYNYVEIKAATGYKLSSLGLKISSNNGSATSMAILCYKGDSAAGAKPDSAYALAVKANGTAYCDSVTKVKLAVGTKKVRIARRVYINNTTKLPQTSSSSATTYGGTGAANIFSLSATAEAEASGKMVYLKNSMGWATAYVTLQGNSDGYWNASNGSGSNGKTTYTMSYDSSKKLFYVEVPAASNDTYICFTKDEQKNYENFYNTEAIYVNGSYSFGKVVWISTNTTFSKNGTTYYENTDFTGVEQEDYSADVYLSGSHNEWAKNSDAKFTEGTPYTKTVSLTAGTAYTFKIVDNAWFGLDNTWLMDDKSGLTFSQVGGNVNLLAPITGDYTFTYNRSTHAVTVTYPDHTHPNSGYVYVIKYDWGGAYLHAWGSSDLTSWGSDLQLSYYEDICGTEYWCIPVLSDYPNFAVKDNAGDPSNTTGNQSFTSNGGKNMYHDGSSWGWHSFTSHTISYAKGTYGSGTMSSTTGICNSADQELPACSFSPSTGYEFSHWTADVAVTVNSKTVSIGSPIADEATLQNITGNIALTANWSLVDYNVTYSAPTNGSYTIKVGDGPATSATKTANMDNTVAIAATPLDGYYFTGWTVTNTSTSADVTSTLLAGAKATTASTNFTMPAYGVTIVATFAAKKSVTYKKNGGASGADGSVTGSTTDASSPYAGGAEVTTVANGFTNSGYKFKWWNTTYGGDGEDFYPGEKFNISANTLLYAQWEQVASGWEYWVGDNFTFTDNVMSVGDLRITRSSSGVSSITDVSEVVSKYNSTTDKKANTLKITSNSKYVQLHFSDGSPINALELGVATDQTSNKNIVVCYSTTADFSSGAYEFKKVGSTDNLVSVPGKNQSSKVVTDVSPSTTNKYTYVRIYRKLANSTDYNSTGGELGSGNNTNIYSIKAQKGCLAPTTTFSAGAYTVGDDALDLRTLLGSKQGSGAITFEVTNDDDETGATIDVDGYSFTATSAGSCTVTATQAASTPYCEKVIEATITVSPACTTPTVSWSTTPANGIVGGSMTASVTTNYSDGLAYSVTGATPSSCVTINGSTGAMSYVKPGTATVKATVTGDGTTYCEGPAEVSQAIIVHNAQVDDGTYVYYYSDETHFDGTNTYNNPEGNTPSTGENIAFSQSAYTLPNSESIDGLSVVVNSGCYDNKGNHINSYIKLTGGTSTIVFTIETGYTATIKIKAGGYSGAQPYYMKLNNEGDAIAPTTGSMGGAATIEDNFTELVWSDLEAGSYTFKASTSGKNLYVSQIDIETTLLGYAITNGSPSGGTIAITDGSSAITSSAAGETVHITATPSTGYGLTSWSVYKTGDAETTVALDDDDDLDNKTRTFTMPAYGVTVNATFTGIVYTVTLNTNGGMINEGDVTSYRHGEGATLPTNVTKDSYRFMGWYDNSGLTGDPVTEIGTSEYGNKEYWAKWAELYPITTGSHANGVIEITNSSSEVITEAIAGETVSIDATAGTHYAFSEWSIYKTSDGETSVPTAAATASTSFTMPAYGVTVNATFAKETLTLSYDKGGAEGSVPTNPAAGSIAYGTEITVPGKNTLAKDEDAFVGWLYNDKILYTTGQKFTMTENVTLTAVWNSDCPAGGSGTSVYKFHTKTGMTPSGTTININKSVTSVTTSDGDVTATSGNYLSELSGGTLGMNLGSNGDIRIATDSCLYYNNSSAYMQPTLSTATIQRGDIIKYRISGNAIDVRTSASDYSANTDVTLLTAGKAALATNSMHGLSSVYLYRNSSSAAYITYFEIYRPSEVLFYAEAATGMTAGNVSATETQRTTSDYLRHINGGNLYTGGNSDGDVKITANELQLKNTNGYIKITLSKALAKGDIIIFNSSTNYQTGITLTKSRSTTISTANKMYPIPADNILIGESTIYLWKGSGDTNIRTIAIVRPGNSSECKFDVSFANENGFAGGATVTLPSNIEGVPTGKKMAQPADPTTTGDYVFGGWYDDEDCSDGHEINWSTMTITGDKTIYAKWFDADYTITWMVNGETYATTKACEDVSTIVLPTAPADNTLDDCANSFRGWSETNLYGEANEDQPSDLFVDAAGAPTINADKTFYAVFGTATDAAYKGTVLWSEDWTGAANNSTPSTLTGGGYAAVGSVIGYTYTDGTGDNKATTKVATGTNAGGVTPELMVGYGTTTAGAFTVTGLPSRGAKELTLIYKRNHSTTGALTPSVTGTGYSISKVSGTGADTYVYTITCGSASTFDLTLTGSTTNGNNVRVDDIILKVKEDGATDYRCICPSLTLAGPSGDIVFVTSTASKEVRSQEAFTVSGTGLTKSRALTTGNFGNSKFAFKSATGGTVSTDSNGDLEETEVYVFYTPDAEDDTDGLDEATEVTISIEGAGAVTSNDLFGTKRIIGRHLPANFVIAAKNTTDNKWYALPSTMSPGDTPTPVEIAVDDIDNPSVAYTASSNIYGLAGPTSNNISGGNGQYVRLTMSIADGSSGGPAPLYAAGSSAKIGKNGTSQATSDLSAAYWWLLTQTNASITNPQDAKYTIASPGGYNSYSLRAWWGATGGPKWGQYNSGENTLRLIPASSAVFAEAEIVAWGKNSAIVEVDNSTMIADYAIAKLPEDIESSPVTLSQTRTSVKGTGTRYNYTMNFGEGVDFSANGGKMLTLEWYDALDNFKAVSNIMVPCIVADDITINKSNYSNKSDWNKEVHVLPGVTVTVDASAYTSSNVTIKELVIYPGAKVIAENGTLITPTLVLRNGWNRLTAETEYNVSQLYITPTTGNLQATNAYADWYIDYDQYYPIAVPWKVATANIAYRNTSGAASDGVMIRYYDGERRAKGGPGNTNWKQYEWGVDMPTYLEPGIGHAITARRPAGKAFSIVRLPLTIPSAAWTTAGEQGEVSDTHKDQVAVTAWVKDEGETPEYAKGWNFVANPYMSVYEGVISFTPDDEPEGDYEDEITYVNIPDVNFKEFEQVAAETAELKPGCGFLIQTEYNGTITFGTENRKASAPSYRTSTPRMPKQKAYILLSGEEAVDQMGLIIADRYTENYEVNADLEKLLSDGNTLRTYMQYGNLNMAYVAINSMLAQELIPVSVRIPAAGEYTYSLHYASRVSELEGIYLVDYMTNKVTNLMESDYTFTSEAGTITDRFAINAIEGQHETPTDIDVVQGGGDIQADHPIKFIYQEKVYIYHKGVIYDAMGKKVAERRAAL